VDHITTLHEREKEKGWVFKAFLPPFLATHKS